MFQTQKLGFELRSGSIDMSKADVTRHISINRQANIEAAGLTLLSPQLKGTYHCEEYIHDAI